MWRHRCAGGLKKKLYLRSGSQRHRHFAGFFNVPVLHRHGTTLFIRRFRHTAPFSRLWRHDGDTKDGVLLSSSTTYMWSFEKVYSVSFPQSKARWTHVLTHARTHPLTHPTTNERPRCYIPSNAVANKTHLILQTFILNVCYGWNKLMYP